ncbi:SH3 domain-containing protein [Streptomyces sp. NPDC048636]|uniref:SH3 domain-containing protein n=1 Tax=Streptomyces sp. NPDC048636 TaxID=3155762 RepID=UPI0034377712
MKIKRKASMVVLSAALLMGGSVALAPTASAVGMSACRFNSPDITLTVDTSGARFRTGPGKRYRAIGTLYRGQSFLYYCRTRGFAKSWSYGKIKSGHHAGKTGWVYSQYLD